MKVDVRGVHCPLHLIKLRNALNKAEKGELILIKGNDEKIKKELLIAIEELNQELIFISNKGEEWKIKFKKG